MGFTKATHFILVLFVAFLLPASALAEDARYNFASAQDSQNIVVTTGGEGVGTMFFYNLDGNRITHVSLQITDPLPGATLALEPSLHESSVELGGTVLTVSENLYVEPSTLLPGPAESVPEGAASIFVPGRGHVLAKVARLVVKVPEGTKPGELGKVRVLAEASWLGQSGTAALKQARDFDFSIQVILPGSSTEKVLGESPKAGAESSGAVGPFDDLASTVTNSAPAFAAGALVLLGLMRVSERVSRGSRRGRG